jgi:hypothetical protein
VTLILQMSPASPGELKLWVRLPHRPGSSAPPSGKPELLLGSQPVGEQLNVNGHRGNEFVPESAGLAGVRHALEYADATRARHLDVGVRSG